jgi:hypothetical protein
MASKKILVDAFFNTYEDFMNQMIAVYPDDRDFPLYKSGLAMFRRVNQAIIVGKTWKWVSKFEGQIKERDERFFLEYDYTTVTEGEEPLEQTLEKLRGMWRELSEHNRRIVWDYVNLVMELARRCSGNA